MKQFGKIAALLAVYSLVYVTSGNARNSVYAEHGLGGLPKSDSVEADVADSWGLRAKIQFLLSNTPS